MSARANFIRRADRPAFLAVLAVAGIPCLFALPSRAQAIVPAAPAQEAHPDSVFSDSMGVLELPAAQVTGKKTVGPSHTQPQTSLQGKELDRTRGTSLGDALEDVPGVTVLRTGATVSKPVLRGLQGDRIVILNNGVRQEGQQWGSEHAPEVDPYLASRLTVIKGASSVRYGANAMGGVVLVEPWPLPAFPTLEGEAHLAGFSNSGSGAASATVEGSPAGLAGFGWRVQGTARKSGTVATPDYRLNNTGMEELAFSAATGLSRPGAGFDLFYSRFDTQLGIFSGSHIGSLSDLEAALERNAPVLDAPFSYDIARPRQEVTHHLLRAHGFAKPGPRSRLDFTYALQHNVRAEFDHRPLNDVRAARNRPELQYEITTHTADLAWDFLPGGGIQSSLGGNGMAQFNLYEGRPFIPNFLHLGGGGFYTGTLTRGRWDFEAGARYDYRFLRTYRRESGEVVSHALEYYNPSGMVGSAFRPTAGLAVKLHASTAYRPPGVQELFSEGLHHGAAAIEIGDPGLDPERSVDVTSSLEWKGKKRIRGEVSAYVNYIRDYIYLAPILPPTLTIRGAFPTFAYRQTDALLRGGDLSLHLALGAGYSYAFKGSLLRAQDQVTGGYLILMPADRMENGLEWDRPGWWALSDLHAAVSVQSVARQSHAPPDSLDYAPPPAGYHLLHARLGFRVPAGTTALHLDLELDNLFDVRYRDYTNRFRYFADEAGRSISLRLKLPFALPRTSGVE